MPPSLLPSLPRTSPVSSTSSTPRAVSSPLPPDLQTAQSTFSEEKELRGPYASDLDHPSVRVIPTDVEEKSFSTDYNDHLISTFQVRNSSRSPGPSVLPDEGELRPQTSDHPLSHSWWGEEHVVRPKKKTEQTEALQSTRRVSNSLILRWVSSSREES